MLFLLLAEEVLTRISIVCTKDFLHASEYGEDHLTWRVKWRKCSNAEIFGGNGSEKARSRSRLKAPGI
jgi:hypothetical protein